MPTKCDSESCPFEFVIQKLERDSMDAQDRGRRLEEKIDGLTAMMSNLKGLEVAGEYRKEAMDRAFLKSEELETRIRENEKKIEDLISRAKGAATFGKIIWGIIGGVVALASWLIGKSH